MNNSANKWFSLFASCQVVEGKTQSLLYDVERDAFYDLPNDFLNILRMAKTNNVCGVKAIYGNEQGDSIDHFFNHLVEEEIGFYTNSPNSFPAIDFMWRSPNTITNSIIEIGKECNFNFEDLVSQLNNFGCKAIQIRLLHQTSINEISEIIKPFSNSRINHVDLLLPYDDILSADSLFAATHIEPRVNRIVIYAAPEEKIIFGEKDAINQVVIYRMKDIRLNAKEIVKKERFTTNMEMFSEAQRHNLGLNRKICVDKNGTLKNYINHEQSFGNINEDKIADVINKKEFKEKWFIPNDQIVRCRDCQYRYSCVSNSDIVKINDDFQKVDKCGFDPATNKWKEVGSPELV